MKRILTLLILSLGGYVLCVADTTAAPISLERNLAQLKGLGDQLEALGPKVVELSQQPKKDPELSRAVETLVQELNKQAETLEKKLTSFAHTLEIDLQDIHEFSHAWNAAHGGAQ